MQRGGQAGRGELEMAGSFQPQRQAQQRLFDLYANLPHQAQGFAVSAEQDVLAVIEPNVVAIKAARPAAKIRRRFEYSDWNTLSGKLYRCTQPCPAGANDSYLQPNTQVVQASHNLRSGVRLMCWLSTFSQPPAWISLSKE